MGDPGEVPGSWLLPGPAIGGDWGNESVDVRSISVSISASDLSLPFR